MAQLFADENFPLPVVAVLRSVGHDVVTTQDAGLGGGTDEAILAAASADGRAVLTLNRRHFIRIHGTSPDHAGIIVCTVDPDEAALASRIDARIKPEGDLSGKLIRINRPR